MSERGQVLTEEQLDFLTELMNVGIGNAAAALEQLLKCQVEVKVPRIKAFLISELESVFNDPSLPVACVRMGMVGDVSGDLFFITPDEERDGLVHLAENATPWPGKIRHELAKAKDWESSILTEIANITAGTYLASICEFSRLKLYHTVPFLTVDMIQAILDETLAERAQEDTVVIMIQNDFILSRKHLIAFFLLLIPTGTSMQVLADSLETAKKTYGYKE